ncbi:MAG: Asp-tRNA(Asn)/Glu-tRNA(Gln) amidotransferase subunit GatC [bacterium]|nr:Asp-tRNA(Asn)/Glu-tRNA(Gln) amidotransferase subunit GatC [bacterium]
MISIEEIRKLANLARIKLDTAEEEKLSQDMGSILDYVKQIQEVGASAEQGEKQSTRNVLRDDTLSHESGIHTEAILAEAPQREGDYVKVKKIL